MVVARPMKYEEECWRIQVVTKSNPLRFEMWNLQLNQAMSVQSIHPALDQRGLSASFGNPFTHARRTLREIIRF